MRDDWSPYSDSRWVYRHRMDCRTPGSLMAGRSTTTVDGLTSAMSAGSGVPRVEWGPARVSWRHSSSHVGWAPAPPGGRFSISIGFNSWVDNYYDIGPSHYRFVEGRNFGSRRLQHGVR